MRTVGVLLIVAALLISYAAGILTAVALLPTTVTAYGYTPMSLALQAQAESHRGILRGLMQEGR